MNYQGHLYKNIGLVFSRKMKDEFGITESGFSNVTASSSGRFDRKVWGDRTPQIFQFSSRVHWIFRFAGAPDFAVKSARGSWGQNIDKISIFYWNFKI